MGEMTPPECHDFHAAVGGSAVPFQMDVARVGDAGELIGASVNA